MAALADAVIKGGVGTIGFVASAATLTKFILSTHVVSGHGSVVVLCLKPACLPFTLTLTHTRALLSMD